jgi:hypothetical protein
MSLHRMSTEIFLPKGAAVNRKDQKQLQDIRRSRADTAEHVAKSRRAIEDSLSVLQSSDGTDVGQKPVTRRRRSEGRGPDLAAREKTRPSRSAT